MPRGVPADLVGRQYGSWTVLSREGVGTAKGQVMWLCQCACTFTRLIGTANLVNGKSRQCRSCSNRRGNSARWPAPPVAPQSDMSASDQKGPIP